MLKLEKEQESGTGVLRKRAVSLAAAGQGRSQGLWRWDRPCGHKEGHTEKHRFLRAPSGYE